MSPRGTRDSQQSSHTQQGSLEQRFHSGGIGLKQESQLRQTLSVRPSLQLLPKGWALSLVLDNVQVQEGDSMGKWMGPMSVGVPYSTILFPEPLVWDRGQSRTAQPETVAASPPSLPCSLQPFYLPTDPLHSLCRALHLSQTAGCETWQNTLSWTPEDLGVSQLPSQGQRA